MIRFFRQLYVTNRLFMALGAISLIFVASFFIQVLFAVAQASLILLAANMIVDAILLFNSSTNLSAKRNVQQILSLGDENVVSIEMENRSSLSLRVQLIDELPEQFQRRDFSFNFLLTGREKKKITYSIRPVTRGVYHFGGINILFATFIGLLQRRSIIPAGRTAAVYP